MYEKLRGRDQGCEAPIWKEQSLSAPLILPVRVLGLLFSDDLRPYCFIQRTFLEAPICASLTSTIWGVGGVDKLPLMELVFFYWEGRKQKNIPDSVAE